MSKIAFIYPGQGAQKAGMGKDFYENSALAAAVYDEASQRQGLDMKHLCFEANEQLDLTEYTQAAMVTTCLAMTKVIEDKGLRPDVTAGLSLGEYCAVSAAGGMDVQDAIALVRQRGILMQNTVPAGEGAMAAVLGLDAAAIGSVLEAIEGATVANYNCPGQIVITGQKAAVETAAVQLKAAGARRITMLNVSGPFHSPMLAPAGEALREAMAQITFSPLRIPYVTNVTAEYVTDIGQTKDLLARQVASSVRWQESMEKMITDGVDIFVEIGPGRTLNSFLRKIDRSARVYNISTWDDADTVIQAISEQEAK